MSQDLAEAYRRCMWDPYNLVDMRFEMNITEAEYGALAAAVLLAKLPDGPVNAPDFLHAMRMMPPDIYRGDHRNAMWRIAMRYWTPELISEYEVQEEDDPYHIYIYQMMVSNMPPALACALIERSLIARTSRRGPRDFDECLVRTANVPLGSALTFWRRPNGPEMYARMYLLDGVTRDEAARAEASMIDEMSYCPVGVVRGFLEAVLARPGPVLRPWTPLLVARMRGAADLFWQLWQRVLGDAGRSEKDRTRDRWLADAIGLYGAETTPTASAGQYLLLEAPNLMRLLPREFVRACLDALPQQGVVLKAWTHPKMVVALASMCHPEYFYRDGDVRRSKLEYVRSMVAENGYVQRGEDVFAVLRIASSDPALARMLWGDKLRVAEHVEEIGAEFAALAFPGLMPGLMDRRAWETGEKKRRRA